jgi:CheY-like chemotaxis protein
VNILVAEDDKVISLLICGLLRKAGHQATPAYDQMQALMFALKSPMPNAIILDLNMPGGSGVETLRRLKSSRTSNIPVIVLTGTVDPGAQELVESIGADAFLLKPVDRESLLREVGRLTGDPSAHKIPDVAGAAQIAS